MVVGALYSPMLFGKKWIVAVGKSPDVLGTAMPKKELAIQFLGALGRLLFCAILTVQCIRRFLKGELQCVRPTQG